MSKLILLFCFFGLVTVNLAHASASGNEDMPRGTAAASADQQCDVCHQNEARNLAWPEGSPFKIQEDAKAKSDLVKKAEADGQTPVTN